MPATGLSTFLSANRLPTFFRPNSGLRFLRWFDIAGSIAGAGERLHRNRGSPFDWPLLVVRPLVAGLGFLALPRVQSILRTYSRAFSSVFSAAQSFEVKCLGSPLCGRISKRYSRAAPYKILKDQGSRGLMPSRTCARDSRLVYDPPLRRA